MIFYYQGSMSGLINRSTLMREILENAINRFEHAPTVRGALHKNVAMVNRDEEYMPFVWELKRKKLRKTFQLAYQTPWVIPEYFQRFGHSLTCHAHRIWHGGRTRGIR